MSDDLLNKKDCSILLVSTNESITDENIKKAAEELGISYEDFLITIVDLPKIVCNGLMVYDAITKKIALNFNNIYAHSIGVELDEKADDWWFDTNESLDNRAMDYIEEVVRIDKNQTREQAITLVENKIKEAKEKDASVYEVAVKLKTLNEFKKATDEEYNLLRKQIFS